VLLRCTQRFLCRNDGVSVVYLPPDIQTIRSVLDCGLAEQTGDIENEKRGFAVASMLSTLFYARARRIPESEMIAIAIFIRAMPSIYMAIN
jgi:hypothetical protein